MKTKKFYGKVITKAATQAVQKIRPDRISELLHEWATLAFKLKPSFSAKVSKRISEEEHARQKPFRSIAQMEADIQRNTQNILEKSYQATLKIARIMLSDAVLERKGREQRREFGKRRGTDRKEAAAKKHQVWQRKADEIKAKYPHKTKSKSELARLVKNELGAPESVETIRRRIT